MMKKRMSLLLVFLPVDELDDKLLKEELVPTAVDGSENKFRD